MAHHGWILYIMIPLLLVVAFLVVYAISGNVRSWFSHVLLLQKAFLSFSGTIKKKDDTPLNESLEVLGYAYDPSQDIFYSILYPWQRKFGYCRLYDEAAAPMGIIMDCEPIYFEYGGREWMIEFWKGQYGLTTGCEIGVYTANGPDLNIPGVFNGTFYDCVDVEDFLHMSCSLKKNGRTLFKRKGIHWWLTGFKLGEFSQPSELTMNINIALKDGYMRNAFIGGLRKAGYSHHKIEIKGNVVSFVYAKPHSLQPYTRTKVTDAIFQKKNKLLCDKYKEATKGCITLQDKFKAVKEKAPEIYGHVSGLGRPKQLYDQYESFWGGEDE